MSDLEKALLEKNEAIVNQCHVKENVIKGLEHDIRVLIDYLQIEEVITRDPSDHSIHGKIECSGKEINYADCRKNRIKQDYPEYYAISEVLKCYKN